MTLPQRNSVMARIRCVTYKYLYIMKDYLTTEDWFLPPRARGHFFQYFRYDDVIRTPAQYKALKRIVDYIYHTLPSCDRTYRTGNRKNFEKSLKQHREAIRHVIINMLQSFIHGSAVFIPLGQYYWDSECKKKNSMINYRAIKDIMNDMIACNLVKKAAKHYYNGDKDRSNCSAYIPTDKMIHMLWETNRTLFDKPITTKKKTTHQKNWTNIHVKSMDKKSRDYLTPSEVKEDTRFKGLSFNSNYAVFKSIGVMERYNDFRQNTNLVLRVSLGNWLALPATSKRHFISLVASQKLNPVTYHTSEFSFSLSELQSKFGKVSLRLFPGVKSSSNVIENNTINEKNNHGNETIIRGLTNSNDYKEIEVQRRMDSFDDFAVDLLGVETIDYELAREDLFRVFNEDGTRGGRYYGSVVQSIPKELRKKCLYVREVNGSMTRMVELDYACNHVSILRAISGLKGIPDAYGDVTGDTRKERKLALLTALNAESYHQAVDAIRDNFIKVFRYRGDKLKNEYIQNVLKDVEKINSDIAAEYFYTGVGAKLQAIDSFIATQIMSAYMNESEKLIECIHDSFMVCEEDSAVLMRIMIQEYRKALKTSNIPTISV